MIVVWIKHDTSTVLSRVCVLLLLLLLVLEQQYIFHKYYTWLFVRPDLFQKQRSRLWLTDLDAGSLLDFN